MQLLERVQLARPFHEYFELFRGRPHAFLLDGEAGGRFSAMGAVPFAVFRATRIPRARDARIEVERGSERRVTEGDPFAALQSLLAEHAVPWTPRPVPLLAGAIGYLGYGAAWFDARLPEPPPADGLPDIAFGLYDAMLVHCHRTAASYVSARTTAERDALLRRLATFEAPAKRRGFRSSTPSITERTHYEALVMRAQGHIAAGDAYELCLTHRIDAHFEGSTWELYRSLRAANPAPYASYLELPEGAIVSSSPETFVHLDEKHIAASRPIKGTRPRGKTRAGDAALRDDLASSEKDKAENAMIVDLVRNDLGRVCRFGTIEVPALFAVETHPTVHQMVSTIRGRLDEGKDAIDLVRACFPPGSMTGAPKIEAMKILNRLERVGRGAYSGAIGYIDFSGTMDLAVTIRTIVVSQGMAHVGVGGAVVAGSDPAAEFEETMHKARASLDALRGPGRPEERSEPVEAGIPQRDLRVTDVNPISAAREV